jgi:hypothetical protein
MNYSGAEKLHSAFEDTIDISVTKKKNNIKMLPPLDDHKKT